MVNDIVDVAIVGSGPAGYFTALKLVENFPKLKIVIFEKGNRRKLEDETSLYGWGGAGTSSDGKLNLAPHIGGWLDEFIPEPELLNLLDYVENTYLKFGFPQQKVFGLEPKEKIEKLRIKALKSHLTLKTFKLRHAGTDGIFQVTENIYNYLQDSGAEVRTGTPVKHIKRLGSGFELELENGQRIKSSFAVLAPGRAGSGWLRNEALNFGLKFTVQKKLGVDLGVRFEVPFEVTQEYTDLLHEFKLEKYTNCFEDLVRTFCVCPRGQVDIEEIKEMDCLQGINGHSFASPDKWSANTNFAVLVKANFTEPFRDPIGYATGIAKRANDLGGGKPLIQRLVDLKNGKRSRWDKIDRGNIQPTLKAVEPGDLSYALPYRIQKDILEVAEDLELIFPGLTDNSLVYGVEIKLYSSRIETREGFETAIDNLYVGGDGSGYSRSISHAAVMGVKIAQAITKRCQS